MAGLLRIIHVHICDTEIYYPFENGDAAALSIELLKLYGHDNLTSYFMNVEDVFLYEMEIREQIAGDMIADDMSVSGFLTHIDMGMQKQAWLTEQIWMAASNVSNEEDKQKVIDIISGLWEANFSVSLDRMENAIYNLEDIPQTEDIVDDIRQIMLTIFDLRIDTCKI